MCARFLGLINRLSPTIAWPVAWILFSPLAVNGSSVVPVCRPLRDHSVSPCRIMKTRGTAIAQDLKAVCCINLGHSSWLQELNELDENCNRRACHLQSPAWLGIMHNCPTPLPSLFSTIQLLKIPCRPFSSKPTMTIQGQVLDRNIRCFWEQRGESSAI